MQIIFETADIANATMKHMMTLAGVMLDIAQTETAEVKPKNEVVVDEPKQVEPETQTQKSKPVNK